MSDITTQSVGTIENLLLTKKVVLVLGPGGVGKTTSSVGLALLAATMGKKVGLLSIDPAKRLADAMGIKLGHELYKVPLGSHIKGELHACMLDQAAVFDGMVRRFSTEKIAEKIFNNQIYHQASRNLGGPLEYMALAKLGELLECGEFDLVVLDTPPDTHAIEFLVKPNILAGFVEKGVMTWLIKPFHLAQKMGMGKIFGFSERIMGGVASVTGAKMLERLSEFLILMDSVIKGFHQSSQNIASQLREKETSFIVVLSPTSSGLRSACSIQQRLYEEGFSLDAFLVNRVLPSWQNRAISQYKKEDLDLRDCNWIMNRLHLKQTLTYNIFKDLQTQHQQLFNKYIPILGLPESRTLLHDMEGIESFARNLRSTIPVNA